MTSTHWKAGWLQPLDAYIADPKLTDASWDPKDFFASFAKASSVDGKQIGVVINAETSLLAYRKDLFTKFNQKVPTTMKELEDVAKFFHRQGGGRQEARRHHAAREEGGGHLAVGRLPLHLRRFLDQRPGQVEFRLPRGHRGVQVLRRSAEELRAAGRHHAALGREHFQFHGRQGGDDLRRQRVQVAVREPEGIEGGRPGRLCRDSGRSEGPAACRTSPTGASSIAKTSTPERQKAAWLFIQWATNKENSLGALLAGVPSGRISSWASKEYKADDKQPDWTAATMKSFDIGQGQWNPPVINVPEIRDITGQVIVDAIEGKDVAESARKAAELMDKKMERVGWCCRVRPRRCHGGRIRFHLDCTHVMTTAIQRHLPLRRSPPALFLSGARGGRPVSDHRTAHRLQPLPDVHQMDRRAGAAAASSASTISSRAFGDERVWNGVKVMIYFSGASLALELVLGLMIALYFNRAFKGSEVVQAIYIIPFAATPVAVALIWRIMLNPEIGVINYLLTSIGLPPGPVGQQRAYGRSRPW